jgi:hypothetical protein
MPMSTVQSVLCLLLGCAVNNIVLEIIVKYVFSLELLLVDQLISQYLGMMLDAAHCSHSSKRYLSL